MASVTSSAGALRVRPELDPSQSLTDYLNCVFLPPRKLRPRVNRHYRYCLGLFQQKVGQSAKIRDLTEDNFNQWKAWLKKKKLSPPTIRNIYNVMRTVRKSTLRRVTLDVVAASAPEQTFEREYIDNVRPSFTSVLGMQRTSILELDLIVSRFAMWRGRCTPVSELSEKLIEEYLAWAKISFEIDTGTIKQYGSRIRRLIRRIDPTRCREIIAIGGRNGMGKAKIIDPPVRQGTVWHFFETVYRVKRLLGKSPNTLRLYTGMFRKFARYLGREALLSDLTDDAIAGFVTWNLDRGRSVETAVKDANQLMAVARYAFRKKAIEFEPEVALPTPPKRAPLAWMMEELWKLFATIDRLPGEVAGVPARLWWKALLLLIYYTGERISAVMSLKLEHINFDMATAYVPAEFRKGKRSDKIFSLPPVVIESLRALGQRPDSDSLFPWNLNSSMLFKKLKTIHRRAGLPSDRRSMFHRMRRTAASWYKAKGGDPTQLLDHADAKTTARYLDLRICQTRSPAKLLDDPTAQTGGAE